MCQPSTCCSKISSCLSISECTLVTCTSRLCSQCLYASADSSAVSVCGQVCVSSFWQWCVQCEYSWKIMISFLPLSLKAPLFTRYPSYFLSVEKLLHFSRKQITRLLILQKIIIFLFTFYSLLIICIPLPICSHHDKFRLIFTSQIQHFSSILAENFQRMDKCYFHKKLKWLKGGSSLIRWAI